MAGRGTMKVGVQLPHFGPHASGEGAVSLAVEAERLGFDSVWVGDHVVYPAELVAGLEHVIVNPYYGIPPALMPESLGACGRLLARFAREVLPQLAAS